MKHRTVRSNRELPMHLMLLPGVILVLIFSYFPMAGIVIAFQNFIPSLGFSRSEWVGLDNFRYVLSLPDTLQVFWNTIYISALKIAAGLAVPVTVALLLNELGKKWFKGLMQTLIYVPHFLSWVILGGILIDVLSPSQGLVNQVLSLFGFDPIYFLGDNSWFPNTLIVTNTWKEFGFGTIVYLAALTGLNPNLYEAAMIDGAGRWKQTLHITLPGIIPVVVLMATLSLGHVLNAGFDQVFNLYSPVVYQSGDIIDTMVYRIGLVQAQFGVATAVGLLKSVVSFLLISVCYWLAYRFANYQIF
ncbi:ABC transporter permease subunit [Paenibacillus sp. HB172176]|uniref:ABC transporter permease n=1 Tax=Paenibacillus sp. HB172176 TaxID=2493690 RepID=UPI00143A2D2E|nr:ABC transporter permease subunit [Paenibacillus sp. HB172176]